MVQLRLPQVFVSWLTDMLVKQGEERSNGVDCRLAFLLAFVAGAVNAAAFYAAGFFSANMTGNASLLSARLMQGHFLTVVFLGTVILAFIGGSVCSTTLINIGKRRKIRAIYAYSILTEAWLLAAITLIDGVLNGVDQSSSLILCLSFLMGLQNAVVTRISNARVRTTHVSGMITDVGIEIAMLLDYARGRQNPLDIAVYRNNLSLHIITIVAFLTGGAFGTLAEGWVGRFMLLGTSILLFVAAINGIFGAHKYERRRVVFQRIL